jgi:hypothetical protein
MSNLRKAAEMALEAFALFDKAMQDPHSDDGWKCLHISNGATQALRQALAESANSTTNFVEPKAPVQQEQEAFTLDRGCWERGCCAYDTRDGDGVIVYVDAVNMSQERVDETAECEHEPEWIEDGFGTMWQKCGKKDCGKFVVKIGKADCWNGDCPELKGKNA